MKLDSLIKMDLESAREELDSFLSDSATVASIRKAAEICIEALSAGNKIISCGNGGSLCDATHFAEELTGRYRKNRRPLPALAINDPAYMTCTGNDFAFCDIFSRYVEGVGNEGDVLLAISTSGKSGNILAAAEAAAGKGMKVVALTGPSSDNPLCSMADAAVCAPAAAHSDRIQEIHIKVIHILIHSIENGLGLDDE